MRSSPIVSRYFYSSKSSNCSPRTLLPLAHLRIISLIGPLFTRVITPVNNQPVDKAFLEEGPYNSICITNLWVPYLVQPHSTSLHIFHPVSGVWRQRHTASAMWCVAETVKFRPSPAAGSRRRMGPWAPKASYFFIQTRESELPMPHRAIMVPYLRGPYYRALYQH